MNRKISLILALFASVIVLPFLVPLAGAQGGEITVLIISPAPESPVYGLVNITLTASTNASTNGSASENLTVQVMIDNGTWQNASYSGALDETGFWVYSWDTDPIPNGTCCNISARATDGTSFSAVQTVRVQIDLNPHQNIRPLCNIVYEDHMFTLSKLVHFTGNASDADGTVERVQLSINYNEFFDIPGTTEWNYTWDTTDVEAGDYVIYARSYDGHDFSEDAMAYVGVNDNTIVACCCGILAAFLALVVGLVALIVALNSRRKKRKGAEALESRQEQHEAALDAARQRHDSQMAKVQEARSGPRGQQPEPAQDRSQK